MRFYWLVFFNACKGLNKRLLYICRLPFFYEIRFSTGYINACTAILLHAIPLIVITVHAFIHPWIFSFITGQYTIKPVMAYFMIDKIIQHFFIRSFGDQCYGWIFHTTAIWLSCFFYHAHYRVRIFAQPFALGFNSCFNILYTVSPVFFVSRIVISIHINNFCSQLQRVVQNFKIFICKPCKVMDIVLLIK